MDINMPVMDGLEATRRIRTKESLRTSPSEWSESIKTDPVLSNYSQLTTAMSINLLKGKHQNIVACSANGDDITVQEALQCGADAFIIKPFTLSAFQDIMKSLHLEDKL